MTKETPKLNKDITEVDTFKLIFGQIHIQHTYTSDDSENIDDEMEIRKHYPKIYANRFRKQVFYNNHIFFISYELECISLDLCLGIT